MTTDLTQKQAHPLVRFLDGLDSTITALIMIVIFVDVILQVLTRVMPIRALAWTNELGEMMLSCLIWIGASAAVKNNNHIGFDLIVSRLSPAGKKFMGMVNMALFMFYLGLLAYLAWGMIQLYLRRITVTPILGVSMYWVRMPIVVGCLAAVMRLLVKEYLILTDREKMYDTAHLGE